MFARWEAFDGSPNARCNNEDHRSDFLEYVDDSLASLTPYPVHVALPWLMYLVWLLSLGSLRCDTKVKSDLDLEPPSYRPPVPRLNHAPDHTSKRARLPPRGIFFYVTRTPYYLLSLQFASLRSVLILAGTSRSETSLPSQPSNHDVYGHARVVSSTRSATSYVTCNSMPR